MRSVIAEIFIQPGDELQLKGEKMKLKKGINTIVLVSTSTQFKKMSLNRLIYSVINVSLCFVYFQFGSSR